MTSKRYSFGAFSAPGDGWLNGHTAEDDEQASIDDIRHTLDRQIAGE